MSDKFSYKPLFSYQFLLPKYWLNWLGIFLFWIFSLFPFSVKRGLAKIIGAILFRFYHKRRHIVLVNLKLAFPGNNYSEHLDMAKEFFFYAALMILDMPLLWWGSDNKLAERIKINGLEHVKNCQQQNKPVILLTCHMLALEFGALALTKYYESVGLIKPARNKLVDWLVAHGRTRFKGQLYGRDTGIRAIVRAIKQGRIFYYLPDEDLTGKAETIFASFFAEQAASVTALGRLAKLTGAAVLPATTILDEKTGIYTLSITPALEHFPEGNDQQDVLKMNQELEKLIKPAVSQYMWSLRLYQSRPGGAASPYEQS